MAYPGIRKLDPRMSQDIARGSPRFKTDKPFASTQDKPLDLLASSVSQGACKKISGMRIHFTESAGRINGSDWRAGSATS